MFVVKKLIGGTLLVAAIFASSPLQRTKVSDLFLSQVQEDV